MDMQERQAKQEREFLAYPGDAFAIYQINDVDDNVRLRFLALRSMENLGYQVERKNYNLVYVGEFSPTASNEAELEKLYERFNINHPTDYCGRSLSVSDIVVLKRDGVVSCHYCDSIGFKDVPGFIQDQRKSQPDHTEQCVKARGQTERER